MKQIKTIMRNASAAEEFDAEVNKAIAEGWTLVKREVLRSYDGEANSFIRMLYAELEREEAPRACWTCKHYKKDGDVPCARCDKNTLDKWEQGEVIVFTPLKVRKR